MSKKDVLKAFKTLRRISEKTFNGDVRAINEGRTRMKLEFRKEIKSDDSVESKLRVAKEVGDFLKFQVVQAVKNPESDSYALKLRKETSKLDNIIFKEDAIMPPPRSKKCKPDSS